jgi:hypothetical protein
MDDVLLRAAVVVAVPVVAVPLATGHLSALLVNGGWPQYRAADVGRILVELPTTLDDPGAAWAPVNTGTPVPGPVAWWLTFVLLLALCGLAAWLVARSQRGDAGEDWATPREQRRLVVGRRDAARLRVGTSGPRKLGLLDRHSLLVVGPAHAGKTAALTIPALLEWPGPAVVVSTKGHLVDQTIGWRSHQGDVHVFDPAGMTPYRRSGWQLLASCTHWADAIHTAQDLTAAAAAAVGAPIDGEAASGGRSDGLWRSSAAMALAPFLFAAAASGRSVLEVVDWLEREEFDKVQEILRNVDRAAAHAHAMAFLHPDPARSTYLRLMRRVLGVYEDPVVADSAEHHEVVRGELLDGGHHTLYLTAPEHDQARFQPLAATILRQVLAAAYEHSAAAMAPLDPPLLVVLDQVVGIAPVADLAAIASTGAARGVQVVSVFQDLDQVVAAYGDDAGLLVKNHAAKLVLPTGHELDDLDAASLLVPELADQLREGEAALLYGALPPVKLRLRPWYGSRELRRRARTPQDALAPVEYDPASTYVAYEQVDAWGRKRRPADHDEDPPIPLDTGAADYRAVFGYADADTPPQGVTPIQEARSWLRRSPDGR